MAGHRRQRRLDHRRVTGRTEAHVAGQDQVDVEPFGAEPAQGGTEQVHALVELEPPQVADRDRARDRTRRQRGQVRGPVRQHHVVVHPPAHAHGRHDSGSAAGAGDPVGGHQRSGRLLVQVDHPVAVSRGRECGCEAVAPEQSLPVAAVPGPQVPQVAAPVDAGHGERGEARGAARVGRLAGRRRRHHGHRQAEAAGTLGDLEQHHLATPELTPVGRDRERPRRGPAPRGEVTCRARRGGGTPGARVGRAPPGRPHRVGRPWLARVGGWR